MSGAHIRIPTSAAESPRGRKPTLEDRLIARILAHWLDQELAGGAQASLSAAHAARIGQLSQDRTRRAVTRSLERLIDRAEIQRPRFRITAVPPCRDQVRDATALIMSITSRLRSEEPLDAQGIARLKTLLRDPTGPCYAPSRTDALTVALQAVSEAFDARTAGRRPAER